MGSVDVFTMAADGSDATDVTPTPTCETLGDWSPDGSRLVYSSDASGTDQLYVVPAAGGAPVRVTHDSGRHSGSVVSDRRPDRLLERPRRDTEVFVVAPDGRGERKLTDNFSEDFVEDWQPLRDLRAPIVHALPAAASAASRSR